MKISEPISVPNLSRSAPQAQIDALLSRLVVKYAAPIMLEDEGDAEGNCVILISHGDPEVVEQINREVTGGVDD